MIGLIQKILLNMVEASAGPEAVTEVKRLAGVPDGATFRIDTVYDDAEFNRLLRAACEVLRVSPEQAEDAYGEFFIRDAVDRWPVWFKMSANARELLERQQTIHNTFATGVRDAALRRGIEDKFRVETRPHELVTHYRSPNRLCGLYKALARSVLAHYGETASVEEELCAKRGDAECVIHIRWEPDGVAR